MVLDTLELPIVLAPLAGGPSTPELAAAVSAAGGLGFVAAGYLSAGELERRIERTRELTDHPIGVNLFVPGPAADPATYAPYVERLRAEGLEVGTPRADDDGWEAKLALLERMPVEVVSFTFGCPAPDVLARFREAWVTVTSPDEARAAAAAGAHGLVVQGAEAGGHRGSWVDVPDATPVGLHALLQLIDADVPLVASGGIATAAAVRAVLALGARAAQAGSAFLRAPEAGTSQPHRDALATDAPTALTRAFSGRLARGIRNRFMDEHPDAPVAYPEIHYATAPVRAAARAAGDAELINLWAGEAHALAQELPAAEIARKLGGR
ncbi:MAG TPA: nitronate monooxygenase [Solirubrobacter sp.]|nr:nitronate monooxygenase [Solirubrobacter sp.]